MRPGPHGGSGGSGWLLRRAASRLGRTRPEWAQAMLSEAEGLTGGERLRWALGGWLAASRTPEAARSTAYALGLVASVSGMAAYQWCVDEGPVTLGLACALTAGLVLANPARVVVPAVCVGLVVFTVNLIGTVTGVQPPYETHAHSVLHDLRWTLMVAPVLAAAVLVRWTTGRVTPSSPGGRS